MFIKNKLYIHHYYSQTLFYKILHNTTDRIFKLEDLVGSVFCKYNNIDLEVIFDPVLNDNIDGHHILDFMTILYQFKMDVKFSEIKCINLKKHTTAHRGMLEAEFGVNDIPIMKWIADTISTKINWIIFILRTEKSYIKYDGINYSEVSDLETQIERLSNHYLIDDNIFIDEAIEDKYPNSNYVLTNTIHQWNELLSIRWYYEFKNIFEKLNHPYDLCFSIRYHKRHRKDYMLKLSELDNPKIYLSRVDNCINTEYRRYGIDLKNVNNINFNITNGDNFDDLNVVQNIEHYLDYLMRILPMAKIHILSETWDWTNNITSGYLSEKTYGLVLAGIPFISIHTYPLEMLQKILDMQPHPFYKDAVKYRNNTKLFVNFINTFMQDFENNYELCRKWTNMCNLKLMYLINNNNSFLDLLESNSLKLTNKISNEKIKKII